MKMKDITLAGLISGVIGAICGLILGLILKWIGLTDRTFHDLAQVLILSKFCPGSLAFMIGTLAHFGMGGLFGAIFAHLIAATTRRHLIIKGVFFGLTMWLVLIGLGNCYRLPMFSNMPPLPAFLIWVGSGTYGLIMSFVLSRLTKQ